MVSALLLIHRILILASMITSVCALLDMFLALVQDPYRFNLWSTVDSYSYIDARFVANIVTGVSG